MAVIPSTNVNLATNICDVLNAAGGSVGSDGNVASFFTSEAKINKWAKSSLLFAAISRSWMTIEDGRAIRGCADFPVKALSSAARLNWCPPTSVVLHSSMRFLRAGQKNL